MTVVEALKISRWVKRKAWPDWIGFEEMGGEQIPNSRRGMTREDLVSDDWVPYSYGEIPGDSDPHAVRVSLLELD